MIRDITQDDKNVFLEMAHIFYSSKAVTHNTERHIHEEIFNAAINKSPYLRAFIIEDNGTPAGFALVSFSYATEAGGLAVLLEDIYISEICRGKGLGSTFMRFIEQEYPAAKRFRLEVAKDNTKAIGLYCKLGYKMLDYVQMVKDI
jgi:ribosomal protein S18 acetylase RimI-like enzyme